MKIKVDNLKELEKLAHKIYNDLKPQDIICLSGDLGAGKTTLVQMIAKKCGVKIPVTSPTFEIAKIYDGQNHSFTHIDAYRLENKDNLEMFDDYIYNSGFTFIEWPMFLKINGKTKNINIKIIDQKTREVELNDFGF